MVGFITAEQNHSVNVSHMGEGAIWSITEKIAELMEKHSHHWREQNRIESM